MSDEDGENSLSDLDLLKANMVGVQRLPQHALSERKLVKPRPIIAKAKKGAKLKPLTHAQFCAREAALYEEMMDCNDLSFELRVSVDPFQVVSFRKPGLQHRLFKKFKRGGYEVEGEIDLHRHSVESARELVFEFITAGAQSGFRILRVVHGKGEFSRPQPAVLKSYCVMWLQQLEPVLAFHSAPQAQGGVGATLVLLRNSL